MTDLKLTANEYIDYYKEKTRIHLQSAGYSTSYLDDDFQESEKNDGC